MTNKNKAGSLDFNEKRVIKALLKSGWRNQDIQAHVNFGRKGTVNAARITEVKKNPNQEAATQDELDHYELRKKSFDPITELNSLDDERIVRAREAMILAIQLFNSAAYKFKTEVFSVLAIIAWTYLLHDFFSTKGIKIVKSGSHSISLYQMVNRPECPLSRGAKNNLKAIIDIRNEVEHKLMGKVEANWFGLFQACCINFEKHLTEINPKYTLTKELPFVLYLKRPNLQQMSNLQEFCIPDDMKAFDASLTEKMTEDEINDDEYQFRVRYTSTSASKSDANFELPSSKAGDKPNNVIWKEKFADDHYLHKPGDVVRLVKEQTGKKFTMHNHTDAWKMFNVRHSKGAKQPDQTDRKFCIYHPVHKSYSYSDQWVEHLIQEVNKGTRFVGTEVKKRNKNA